MHPWLFDTLGESRNIYLASKLPLQTSYQLFGFAQEVVQTLQAHELIELPVEHHITWSFLGTKSALQLQQFHDRLMKERPTLKELHTTFNRLGVFRSFVNDRHIISLQPSVKQAKELLSFRQSLRMEDRKPQVAKNAFSPHITLAQLSPEIDDQIVAALLADRSRDSDVSPDFWSLWLHGKWENHKVSVQMLS